MWNGSPQLSLTRTEAAVLCGISVHTFDEWVKKNILPRPIPGTRRWSRFAIERALAQQNTASADPAGSPFEEWKKRNAA
jgi:predicted DNA-binding transcriptional regulator AlpA